MDKDKNIFEAASHKLGKKGKSKSSPRRTHTHLPEKPVVKNASDPEIDEIRSRIRQMQQDISDKLDIINQNSQLKPEQIRNLLTDPKYYTPQQWDELQNYRKSLGDKIFNAIGREIKVTKPTEESFQAPPPKIKDTTDASRKGKTLGARKKWIPMR